MVGNLSTTRNRKTQYSLMWHAVTVRHMWTVCTHVACSNCTCSRQANVDHGVLCERFLTHICAQPVCAIWQLLPAQIVRVKCRCNEVCCRRSMLLNVALHDQLKLRAQAVMHACSLSCLPHTHVQFVCITDTSTVYVISTNDQHLYQ